MTFLVIYGEARHQMHRGPICFANWNLVALSNALSDVLKKRRKAMSYYMSTTLKLPFDRCLEKVTSALQAEGFGVLTKIDVKETMKEKLDVGFRNYHILGACNPPFAHKALEAEDKIGTMLPCNVVIQESAPGTVEVAAVDPVSSMQAVDNEALRPVAEEIRGRLKRMIDSLQNPEVSA